MAAPTTAAAIHPDAEQLGAPKSITAALPGSRPRPSCVPSKYSAIAPFRVVVLLLAMLEPCHLRQLEQPRSGWLRTARSGSRTDRCDANRLPERNSTAARFAGLSSSGGGIRTRDLRVIEFAGGGQLSFGFPVP